MNPSVNIKKITKGKISFKLPATPTQIKYISATTADSIRLQFMLSPDLKLQRRHILSLISAKKKLMSLFFFDFSNKYAGTSRRKVGNIMQPL